MNKFLRTALLTYELNKLATTALPESDKRRGRNLLQRIMWRYPDVLVQDRLDDPHLQFAGGIDTPASVKFTPCNSYGCTICRIVRNSDEPDGTIIAGAFDGTDNFGQRFGVQFPDTGLDYAGTSSPSAESPESATGSPERGLWPERSQDQAESDSTPRVGASYTIPSVQSGTAEADGPIYEAVSGSNAQDACRYCGSLSFEYAPQWEIKRCWDCGHNAPYDSWKRDKPRAHGSGS